MTSYSWFIVLFQTLLLGLKLAEVGDVASWSWWWVLGPMWIPFVITTLFLAGYLIYKALGEWK